MSRYVNDEPNKLGEWIIENGTSLDVTTLTPYEITTLSVLIVGLVVILINVIFK